MRHPKPLALIAVILVLLLPLPASAHTWTELNDFLDDWSWRAQHAFLAEIQPDYLAPISDTLEEVAAEYADMRERHPQWNGQRLSGPIPVAHATPRIIHQGRGVERWRELVAAYFRPGDINRALCLMRYESGGVPSARNPSSGASGLMQIMPFWADDFGVARSALFDPRTNIRLAARIKDIQGWRAWSPYNRGLCR